MSSLREGSADRFMLESLSFENWFELLELLGLVGIVYNIASHCELHARTGDALQFGLDEAHAALFNAGHSDKLKLALGNYFGHPVSVSVAPGALRGETPAMRLCGWPSGGRQRRLYLSRAIRSCRR